MLLQFFNFASKNFCIGFVFEAVVVVLAIGVVAGVVVVVVVVLTVDVVLAVDVVAVAGVVVVFNGDFLSSGSETEMKVFEKKCIGPKILLFLINLF